jgi:hypothetical protein
MDLQLTGRRHPLLKTNCSMIAASSSGIALQAVAGLLDVNDLRGRQPA